MDALHGDYHVFRERKDPFKIFNTECAFRQRYRLSRDLVEELAVDFGESQWATRGTRHAKGLTHRERVRFFLLNLIKGAYILYNLV